MSTKAIRTVVERALRTGWAMSGEALEELDAIDAAALALATRYGTYVPEPGEKVPHLITAAELMSAIARQKEEDK